LITLTGFADEISPELDVQLDVLESEGIHHLEFRGVWGKNVLSLSDEEVARVKETLDRRGFRVSSIGSPIGKIGIQDDFETHLERFRRALQLADIFQAPYIRLFSFFIPQEDHPADHRDEVMRRMKALVQEAKHSAVVLLHENEKDIYGDNGERCLELMQECGSPRLRTAFDPANFVQCGVRPMTDAYPLLAPYIEYIHVKDALFENGKVVPAGEGDGEWPQLIEQLKQTGFSGFMSLEPHLQTAEQFQGFSGPERFVAAVRALKGLLQNAGLSWN
jgi:sugar phosphate isomerase/epimerase